MVDADFENWLVLSMGMVALAFTAIETAREYSKAETEEG